MGRRKQQIPIPKAVTTGWQEKEDYVGPTYFFTDGNSERISYQDCLSNLDKMNSNQKEADSRASTLTGQKKLAPKDDLGWLFLLFLWIFRSFCSCLFKAEDNGRNYTQKDSNKTRYQ